MSAAQAMLAPRALQRTLSVVTERLAHELAAPSSQAPGWSSFEWRVAHAVAFMHGVSPLLATTLSWHGPASWESFLWLQRQHTAERHARLNDLLTSIDAAFRDAGIAVVPLKGMTLHRLGIYQSGDRPMADIDVWVRAADMEAAARILLSLGLEMSHVTPRERVFVAAQSPVPAGFGEHAMNGMKVELHDRIGERLPLRRIDLTSRLFAEESRPGINSYASSASLMAHLLIHAAGCMSVQGLRLLHLHDLALLCARFSDADWREFLALGSSEQPLWWAYPPLKLAARYYAAVPAPVLRTLRKQCPYGLRRHADCITLSEVSFSQLWVAAFPALYWSRSLTEMIEYVGSRLRPSTELRAARQQTVDVQVWAKHGAWGSMSQSRRVLQWLAGRATRHATLHVVEAAFVDAASAQS